MVSLKRVCWNCAAGFLGAAVLAAAGGCGYTTRSALPENIRTIHIRPVQNEIDLAGETGEEDRFRVYRPGVEVDLTNALQNRFIFDGNLRVTSEDKADAVLESGLVDYRRDPLRYTDGDDVQEYRLSVTLRARLVQTADEKVIWEETLTGDTSYFLSGSRALSEDEALAKAVEDLARRVVDRTLEIW